MMLKQKSFDKIQYFFVNFAPGGLKVIKISEMEVALRYKLLILFRR